MVKNCDRGLENAAEVTVFHNTDRPQAAKNMLIIFSAVNGFTDYKWVYLRNSCH